MYAEQKGNKHQKEVLPLFGTLLLLSMRMRTMYSYCPKYRATFCLENR